MGVNVERVIMTTFVVGGLLAGAGGFLYAMTFNASNTMGFVPGVKAFAAAVLGGIGNVRGAMLGGLLLGLVEAYGGYLFQASYKDVIAFLVLVADPDGPTVGPARRAAGEDGVTTAAMPPVAVRRPPRPRPSVHAVGYGGPAKHRSRAVGAVQRCQPAPAPRRCAARVGRGRGHRSERRGGRAGSRAFRESLFDARASALPRAGGRRLAGVVDRRPDPQAPSTSALVERVRTSAAPVVETGCASGTA